MLLTNTEFLNQPIAHLLASLRGKMQLKTQVIPQQNPDQMPTKPALGLASTDNIQLENSWKKRMLSEFEEDYMKELKSFLVAEKKKGKTIFPPGPEIFNAFNSTPFGQVKVVIIGQDPYHGQGQAHGLSFSVKEGVSFPPSLNNILKELKNDLGFEPPKHGDLTKWAQQGVLLLNASLTVEMAKPMSHQNVGWEKFTDKAIHLLNDERQNLVFILWGSFAQKKAQFVDRKKHFVITSPHPSPLSSHRGFFGSRPFSKTNEYLLKHGISAINWDLNS